jgi:hypothetical protein
VTNLRLLEHAKFGIEAKREEIFKTISDVEAGRKRVRSKKEFDEVMNSELKRLDEDILVVRKAISQIKTGKQIEVKIY